MVGGGVRGWGGGVGGWGGGPHARATIALIPVQPVLHEGAPEAAGRGALATAPHEHAGQHSRQLPVEPEEGLPAACSAEVRNCQLSCARSRGTQALACSPHRLASPWQETLCSWPALGASSSRQAGGCCAVRLSARLPPCRPARRPAGASTAFWPALRMAAASLMPPQPHMLPACLAEVFLDGSLPRGVGLRADKCFRPVRRRTWERVSVGPTRRRQCPARLRSPCSRELAQRCSSRPCLPPRPCQPASLRLAGLRAALQTTSSKWGGQPGADCPCSGMPPMLGCAVAAMPPAINCSFKESYCGTTCPLAEV